MLLWCGGGSVVLFVVFVGVAVPPAVVGVGVVFEGEVGEESRRAVRLAALRRREAVDVGAKRGGGGGMMCRRMILQLRIWRKRPIGKEHLE